MTTIVNLLLGIALLTTGRKLYWLFVGVVGFVLGVILSRLFFPSESEFATLAIALVAGVLGAVLTLFLQRPAVITAGFITGGFLLVSAIAPFGIDLPAWVAFLIGGIAGAVLVAVVFDWALILLSSFFGAYLLINLELIDNQWLTILAFVVLSLVGIGIQFTRMRAESG